MSTDNMTGVIRAGGLVVVYDRDNSMLIQLPAATRQAWEQYKAEDEFFGSYTTLHELFEGLLCNSELEWINPADTGDLTDAPMLGICGQMQRRHNLPENRFGQVLVGGDLDGDWFEPILARWAFMGYQLISLQDKLLQDGSVLLVSQS